MTDNNTESTTKPQIYEESSQYQHWRFSQDQLWDIRNKSTEAAVNRVQRNVQEEMAANGLEETEREYLTSREELALCRFYEAQLQAICRHCKFTDMVMATALMYMKRFFLYNTVMDYYPKDILLSSLFLATKSESERISIDEYIIKVHLKTTKEVLDLEFTLSQGIKFQYYIHHPYRPAYGFFLDMQTGLGLKDTELLKETYDKANNTVIAKILLTDLSLIYQPTQLALAAFMIAGEKSGFDAQVETYIKDRFGENDAKSLLSIIKGIITSYKTEMPITQDEAKAIDRKLKMCKNPAMNPKSALYKKRLAEREQEDRSNKKAKSGIILSDSSEENSPSATA